MKEEQKATRYIHYGSEHFYSSLFVPIRNRPFPYVKPDPSSGMWGSPVDSDHGWKEWCIDNDFHLEEFSESFIFELKPGSKILRITNDEELHQLVADSFFNEAYKSMYDFYCLDFEDLLEQGYDAVEVHVTTYDIYFKFYGWDCDSILILNPNCVQEIYREEK